MNSSNRNLYEIFKSDLEASGIHMNFAIKKIEDWVKGCEDSMYLKLKSEFEKQVKYYNN